MLLTYITEIYATTITNPCNNIDKYMEKIHVRREQHCARHVGGNGIKESEKIVSTVFGV